MIEKCAKVWLGGRKGVTAPIHVSQYDTAWRFLLTVYDGDAVYTGGDGTAVSMEGRKADQTVFAVPGTFADGVAVVECTAAMTAAVGPIECELRISEDGETVGTANFEIVVEAAPLKGYVASEDDFSAMQQVLDGANAAAGSALASKAAAAASASAAAVSAATAQVQAGMAYKMAPTAADMVDHSIGYLYTGSETGYIFGGWYYWDESAWVLGGMSVDPTGTVAGAAMEAKSAGDQIRDLRDHNSYDALVGLLTRTDRTVNGVTYAWSGDVCTLTGATGSSVSVCVLWLSTPLPDYIVPGNSYYAKVTTNLTGVSLRYRFKLADDTQIDSYVAGDRMLTIPENAVAWSCGIHVAVNTTIPAGGTTVSGIRVVTALTNPELKDYSEDLVYGAKDHSANTPAAITFWSAAQAGFDAQNPMAPADMPVNCYTRVQGSTMGEGWPDGIVDARYYFIKTYSILISQNVREYEIIHDIGGDTFRGRSLDGGATVTWLMFDEYGAGKRSYTYNETTHDYYYRIRMGTTATIPSFDPLDRKLANPGTSCLLVPVRAGDRIVLRTRSSAAADASLTGSKPWTVVAYNYLIADEFTESLFFDGEINIEQDGFIAINVLNTYAASFKCDVYTNAAEKLRDSMFRLSQEPQFVRQGMDSYDADNITRVLKTGPSFMGAIHSWAIIGASFDSGEFNYRNPAADFYSELEWFEYSPWSYLQRINGIPELYHYADGGTTAQEWIYLDPDAESDPTLPEGGPGGHPARCFVYEGNTEQIATYGRTSGGVLLPYRSGIGPGGGNWKKMYQDYLNGKTYQAYVIDLGGNDISHYYPAVPENDWTTNPAPDALCYACGTIADIGTFNIATNTDTPPAGREEDVGVCPGIVNSYIGYIGAIINRVLAVQPDAIVFLCTCRNGQQDTENKFNVWQEYNEQLRLIPTLPQFANKVFILDNGEFGPNSRVYPSRGMRVLYHPNALGYQHMAYYYNTMIDEIIQNNYAETVIRQSHFIGTGKSYTPIP